MIGYILFFIAVFMGAILYPIGIIYSVCKLVFLYVGNVCKTLAIGINQFGNVVCSDLFNDTLIKPNGVKFGNPDNTISKVLGLNKKQATLTKAGLFIANILNKIDKNHVEDATENK